MTFLPVAERELRAAIRRPATWRVRFWSALLVIVVAAFMLLSARFWQSPAALGGKLFGILSYYSFAFSLFAGLFLTADCLSSEKREGTLGLLFLTDLRGHDVVLGKLLAKSLNAFYGLLTALPVIGLTLILGGVTGGEFWRLSLTLVNTLFLSLTLGLLISAVSRDDRQALGRCFLALLGVIFLPVFLSGIANAIQPGSVLTEINALSPARTFQTSSENSWMSHASGWWLSLCLTHLEGWLFLALAAWILPRTWQERPAKTRRAAVTVSPRQENPQQAARRARLLDKNPVLWLAHDPRGTSALILLITVSAALAALAGFLFADLDFLSVAGGYLVKPFGFMIKVAVAAQACRFFADARRSGSLELLLSTPLTSREIVDGQKLALKQLFFWPVICIAALHLTPILKSLTQLGAGNNSLANIPVYFLFGGPINEMAKMFADVYALGYLGMWLALTVRQPQHAFALTVLYLLVLPSVFFCAPDLLIDGVVIGVVHDKLRRELRARVAGHVLPVVARNEPRPKSGSERRQQGNLPR